jgi:hypothetical protein
VLRRCYMFGRTTFTIDMTADTNNTVDTNYVSEAMTVLKKAMRGKIPCDLIHVFSHGSSAITSP